MFSKQQLDSYKQPSNTKIIHQKVVHAHQKVHVHTTLEMKVNIINSINSKFYASNT